MAMCGKCGGCNQLVSYIWAAQFRHAGQELVLCAGCWKSGKRCFVHPDSGKILAAPKESIFQEVPVWYDEGGYVTGEGGTWWEEDSND
jgi:hypothetical protein